MRTRIAPLVRGQDVRLLAASAQSGNRSRGSVLVLPAAGIPTFLDVDQADTVTLELGAPFRFAAQVDYDGDQAVVNGRSLHIVGKSGDDIGGHR